MRTIFMLLAAIGVLVWIGYSVKDESRELAHSFYAIAIVLGVLLIGAMLTA